MDKDVKRLLEKILIIQRDYTMFEIGRICYKTAGRDSNKVCVIIEKIDDTYVLVDGNTRRKKVNVSHLEPTKKVLKIEKGADSKTVTQALEKEGFTIEKKGKAKKTPKRQVKQKKQKTPVQEEPAQKPQKEKKSTKSQSETTSN